MVTTTRGARDTGTDQWLSGPDQLLSGSDVVTTTRGAKDTGPDQLLSGSDEWSLVVTSSTVICPVLSLVCLLSGSVNKWSVEWF